MKFAEFSCNICRKVMTLPITTPCAHNFCKACLDDAFAGQSLVRNRTCEGRRTLRAQKNIMKCPSCSIDIAEFLQNPQVLQFQLFASHFFCQERTILACVMRVLSFVNIYCKMQHDFHILFAHPYGFCVS